MKIRNNNKDKINKIIISTDYTGGTNISIIINNQLIEMFTSKTYIDEVLDKIKEYIDLLEVKEYKEEQLDKQKEVLDKIKKIVSLCNTKCAKEILKLLEEIE